MPLPQVFAALGIMVLALAIGGCARPARTCTCASKSDDRSVEAPTSQPGRAFVWQEAKLPEGFPPPGPVGEVIVKKYPAYRLARIRAGGGARGENGMFMPLFRHIQRNDIAMTAPVEVTWSPARLEAAEATTQAADRDPKAMAFLYRTPTMGEPGPDPGDSRIAVEDAPAMTVVSIGIRGRESEQRNDEAVRKLEAWIQERSRTVRIAGPPRYLGYNSPFVPGFMRYYEVQIPIEMIDARAH